jgi:hypothetical protein
VEALLLPITGEANDEDECHATAMLLKQGLPHCSCAHCPTSCVLIHVQATLCQLLPFNSTIQKQYT